MDIQHTLIWIYLFVCHHYRGRLAGATQRQSNNNKPVFTDEEVLTIYLFGLVNKRTTISEIHRYAQQHFADWFPDLPSYQSYNRRLNRLEAVFPMLIENALTRIESMGNPIENAPIENAPIENAPTENAPTENAPTENAPTENAPTEVRDNLFRVVDSMPIIMAQGPRASKAKVASGHIPDTGYCSSKDLFYYGVKLHVVAKRRKGTLPLPCHIGVTSAREHDLRALRRVLPVIKGGILCGDKAYCDESLKEQVATDQNLTLVTPVKKKKGQKQLAAADKLFSKAINRLRQPIESLFNWINEKTGIQYASKVRSYSGLLVHVFGRLTAAVLILALNP